MKKFFLLFISLLSFFAVTTSAQNTDEDDVVKITSDVVQLDVIVTDKNGNQVSDLKSSDFTVTQDGKQRPISGFTYIPLGVAATLAKNEIRTTNQTIPLPARPKSGTRGRIITFVVDDGNCRASLDGMRATREALEKFISEQMQPEDVVAIFQTRSGSSMYQQYTSDRAYLLRAAKKIRWYPPAGGCTANDGTFYDAARVSTETITTTAGLKNISAETQAERERRELSEDRQRDHQIIGSLGVLRYAIRGLERVPGRKVLFFMSDGISLRARDGRSLRAVDQLRDLTDYSNRAAVILNTIDVRGVFDTSMIEARDEVSTLGDPLASDKVAQLRRDAVVNSEDGLRFLADETGGTFFKNQNKLDAPLRRALAIEKGYYLIAYEPDEGTFKGKNFNKIEIRVNRPELVVTSRAGFLGVVDQKSSRASKTGDSELYEAIVAPLPTAGMDLRLTASVGNTRTAGTFVRATVHIPGDEVSFIDSDGKKKAVFDVVAVTMNDKNEVIDEFTHNHSISVDAAALPLIERNGLVYSADIKVVRPGFYNFRLAMRDANSRRIGSVSQAIDVPELKPGRIFVSGLSVSAVDTHGKFEVSSPPNPDAPFSLPRSMTGAAVRRFTRGSAIAYSYSIYNARLNAGKPNLTIQVKLYHDGKLVTDAKPVPADLQTQDDLTRVNDYGFLKLNPNLAAGDYVLEVIVTDLNSGEKKASSRQYIDFEVVG